MNTSRFSICRTYKIHAKNFLSRLTLFPYFRSIPQSFNFEFVLLSTPLYHHRSFGLALLSPPSRAIIVALPVESQLPSLPPCLNWDLSEHEHWVLIIVFHFNEKKKKVEKGGEKTRERREWRMAAELPYWETSLNFLRTKNSVPPRD